MGILIGKLTSSERTLLQSGEFGLEKECLRIDQNGYLSHTPHPFGNDPKRDRDFCENQLEMITGVHDSVAGVLAELSDLHCHTQEELKMLPTGLEYLWRFSNPPFVKGEDDICIARFDGEAVKKQQYREYLAEKYGKKKMLFCGIHFNFSFPEALLRADFQHHAESDFRRYKDELYLELAGKVLKTSWLLVYLTAASPVFDGSYLQIEKLHETYRSRFGSARCSEVGYWNQFQPVLDYRSLAQYIDSISQYVKDGQLRSASELYYPVRLKPRGINSLELLEERGVNHIELRMFDLNPLVPVGIDERDLTFVFYLLLHLAAEPYDGVSVSDQVIAIRNMKSAALLDEEAIKIEVEWGRILNIREAVTEFLDQMEAALLDCIPASKLKPIISYQRQKALDPALRYARVVERLYGNDYVRQGLHLAQETKQ